MSKLFIAIAFISCSLMSCKQTDNVTLSSRVYRLESKVDSLTTLVNQLIAYPIKQSKVKLTDKKTEQPYLIVSNTGQKGNSILLTPKKMAKKSTSSYTGGRCMALTKKGTQCKRSARSGGYCWQHGG